MIQRNLQQHQLDCDHDEGLDKEGGIEFRSGIVEHSVGIIISAIPIRHSFLGQVSSPQNRCDKHDQRDIQREARAGLCPVYRVRLVGIGSDRGDYDEYRSHEARYEGRDAHDEGDPGQRGDSNKWWISRL